MDYCGPRLAEVFVATPVALQAEALALDILNLNYRSRQLLGTDQQMRARVSQRLARANFNKFKLRMLARPGNWAEIRCRRIVGGNGPIRRLPAPLFVETQAATIVKEFVR